MVRRIKSITIGSHPSLYSKMEELRKDVSRPGWD